MKQMYFLPCIIAMLAISATSFAQTWVTPSGANNFFGAWFEDSNPQSARLPSNNFSITNGLNTIFYPSSGTGFSKGPGLTGSTEIGITGVPVGTITFRTGGGSPVNDITHYQFRPITTSFSNSVAQGKYLSATFTVSPSLTTSIRIYRMQVNGFYATGTFFPPIPQTQGTTNNEFSTTGSTNRTLSTQLTLELSDVTGGLTYENPTKKIIIQDLSVSTPPTGTGGLQHTVDNTSANPIIPYILNPGRTYELRWYVYGDIATSNLRNLDNLQLFIQTTNTVLPVVFGNINTNLKGGLLSVNWESLTETNNSHFEIEVSKDGQSFIKVGTVISKAVDGNSNNTLNYEFTIPINTATSLLGISFMALGILFFNKKNKHLLLSAMLAGVVLLGISCSKNDTEPLSNNGKLFIRVAQVDKDGKKSYSKVIQIKE